MQPTPDSEPASIEGLLRRQRWLRELAVALVGHGHDADDLVQDTLLAAERSGGAGAVPEPWLARVMRNLAASHWRTRHRRHARESAVARREALPSAAELAARTDVGRRLAEHVLELPPDPQRILLLRYQEGLSSAAIARRLGRPEATVRSQLARALARLRARLEADAEGRAEDWLAGLAPLARAAHTRWPERLAWLFALGTAGKAVAALVVVVGLWLASGPWRGSAPGAPPPAGASVLPPVAATERATDTRRDPGEPVRARAAVPEPRAGAAATVGSLRGVVLDARDGAPVPWYALAIGGVGGELVRTDADGRFRSLQPLPAGEVELWPREDWERVERTLHAGTVPATPQEVLRVVHAPDDEAGVVASLAVGPAFRLDVTPAAVLSEQAFVAFLAPPDPADALELPPTPVQLEPEPFARFAPVDGTARRRAVGRLVLRSEDGRWEGVAPLQLGESNAMASVALELRPAASVEVALRPDVGPGPPHVELTAWAGHLSEAECAERAPLRAEARNRLDPAGMRTTALDWLPVGPVTLRVRALDFADVLLRPTLEQGPQALEAALTRTTHGTGVVAGEVHRPADVLVGTRLAVFLAPTDLREPRFLTQELEFVAPAGSSTASASFRFERLPDQAYRLYVGRALGHATEASWTATPAEHRVRPDGAPVRFVLGVAEPTRPLRVRVVGADGRPLRGARVDVARADLGGEPLQAEQRDGELALELTEGYEEGTLWVRATGHAPALYTLAPGEAGRLAAADEPLVVTLEAGWGALVVAFARDTSTPATGVDVLADGRFVGRTDERGVLVLTLPARPRTLTVDAGGRVARPLGPIDPDGALHPEPDEPLDERYGFALEPR